MSGVEAIRLSKQSSLGGKGSSQPSEGMRRRLALLVLTGGSSIFTFIVRWLSCQCEEPLAEDAMIDGPRPKLFNLSLEPLLIPILLAPQTSAINCSSTIIYSKSIADAEEHVIRQFVRET